MKSLLVKVPCCSSSMFSSLLGDVNRAAVAQAIQQLNVGISPGPEGLPTEFDQY